MHWTPEPVILFQQRQKWLFLKILCGNLKAVALHEGRPLISFQP